LADGLLAILAQHVEVQGVAAEGWLFHSRGRAIPPSTVNSWWIRTREAAKTDAKINLHGLRHFYASGLIAAGCDVVTVQRAMGHSKPSTTLDTYSHLWTTAEDRTRAAAEGMLGEVTTADGAGAGQEHG